MWKSVVVLPLLLSFLISGASPNGLPKPKSTKFFKGRNLRQGANLNGSNGQPAGGKSAKDSTSSSTNSSAPVQFDSIAADLSDSSGRNPTKNHPIEGHPTESQPNRSGHPAESQPNRSGQPDAPAKSEPAQNASQTAIRSETKSSVLPKQIDHQLADLMQNDEDLLEPQEEPGIYEGRIIHVDPDIPVFSALEDGSDDTFLTEISTSACEVDKCKSANQTSPNYHLVDCLSVNLNYDCFYCPKDHVLIKRKRTCIGPCENAEDCQKLLDYYKHVECPYQYKEVEEDQQ